MFLRIATITIFLTIALILTGCVTPTEKMAFWLDRDIKEKLKILAIKEKRTASAIFEGDPGKISKIKRGKR